jgi:serine/threonine protein kinase
MLKPHEARTIAESLFGPPAEMRQSASLEWVGTYRIDRELARGGMGVVYLASRSSDARSGEALAIKVLHASHATLSAKDRIRRECAILERLDHPSIAKILDSGTLPPDGRPWFAMEYVVDGQAITDFVRERACHQRRTIGLFLHVCDAVAHGHQKGVIHRDLKPSNILIDRASEVPKIIDFGIARSTDVDIAATTAVTSLGEVVGTVRYMSPEQCDGDPTRVDTRSDVYSLGVVLHELLCERMPYEVPTHSLFAAANVIRTAAPCLDAAGSLHWKLATILHKALAKESRARYPSVEAFAQDLRAYLNGDPISASLEGTWTRCARWVSRHPIWSGASLLFGLALVTACSGLLTLRYMQSVVEPVLRQEGRFLDLYDGLGNRHRSFDSHRAKGIDVYELIPPDASRGEPPLLLLAMSHQAPVDHAGDLCAYATEGDGEPLWVDGIAPRDYPTVAPAIVKDIGEGSFFVSRLLVADILPDVPGDEIVAIHNHSPGPYAVVRVLDRHGTLRFQFWHRGTIRDLCWSRSHRQLCLTGWNNNGFWTDREGGESMPSALRPIIICGLTPSDDGGVPHWILTGDDQSSDLAESVAPALPSWYLALLPSDYAVRMNDGPHELLPPRGRTTSNVVRLEMRDRASNASVSFTFGEGVEVDDERVPSDTYKSDRSLPPIVKETRMWGPLPPRR